jgi:uncharacterized protein (DUF1800 family)
LTWGTAVKRIWIPVFVVVVILVAGCAGLTSSKSTGGGGGGTPPNQPPTQQATLTVTPATATLQGGTSQTFTAKTSDGSTPTLNWAVNGTSGGSAATGTITSAGVYTAPQFPPTSNTVTVSATSKADSTMTASSAVTLNNPTPAITSVTPTSVAVGNFTLTVNGTNFAPGATLMFGATVAATTRVSATQLTATGTATTAEVGSVNLTVQNPNPGLIASAAVKETVTAPPTSVSVSVTPGSAAVRVGMTQSFSATVTGNSNTNVTWSVNGTAGGSATLGTISATGLYTAPSNLPTPNTVTVTATSAADATKTANGAVTLENPLPVVTAVNPTTIGTRSFLITVTGTGFVKTSVVNFGGAALTTMYVSPTELDATGSATSAQVGSVPVTVTNPNPGGATSASLMAQVVTGGSTVTSAAAVRFLEQSTFGPTPELVNQVQQLGFDGFLKNQLNAPASTYPNPLSTDQGVGKVQTHFFLNAVNDSDQLRQRVAFALNELWVVSQNKVSDPTGYTNYVRALTTDAMGNYFDVMKDVTLTPAMGHYLDMVNNDAPATGQHANENYARELMQLFTLGLTQLNADGTPQLDGSGNPIPTYTQDDVMALGRSFTGWTYPTQSGQTLQKHNPSFYGGPMVAFESNHDSGAKTLLGQPIAAGQSAEQDLDAALTIIFNHPNLPPFVAQQLILKLVTSNPSPAYVSRVAQAFSSGTFNSYGSGKRGDMQATVAAVLLDPEARRGDSSTTAIAGDGKLREPVVMMVGLARMFHATTDGTGFVNPGGNMSQSLFNSGSVFNFFPPQSLIPGTTLNGPEFAIFNTNTAFSRVNFSNTLVYGQLGNGTKVDFTPVVNAGTPDQMADWLNTYLLHGTMSSGMKTDIVTAANAASTTSASDQAKAAIYIVASSSQYQVQR